MTIEQTQTSEMDSMQYHMDKLEQEVEQLRAELEDLKKQLQEESDLGHKAVQEEADSFFEALKYKQCLDEIFEIIDTYGNNGIELSVEKQECILQKIKEVKGNE